jgi:hypothetical protein
MGGSAIPGPNTRDLHPTKQKSLRGDPGLGHPCSWENRRRATAKATASAKTTADPSTHHPRTEIRSGPLSLRMTPLFFVGELRQGEWAGVLSQVPTPGTWGTLVRGRTEGGQRQKQLQVQKQPQILRLTTPELKTFGAPFAQDDISVRGKRFAQDGTSVGGRGTKRFAQVDTALVDTALLGERVRLRGRWRGGAGGSARCRLCRRG